MSHNDIEIDSLWDFNKAAESEAKFRELMPESEGLENRAFQAELLSQIARAEGLQAKFEDAHKTLDEAETLLAPELQRAKVRVLLERGRLFNSSKQAEKSLSLFEKSMQIAEESGEENLAVDAAHMLGIAAADEDKLAWNKRALEMAEAAKDAKAQNWRGSLYNNIG